MYRIFKRLFACALFLPLGAHASQGQPGFVDPLDAPAVMVPAPQTYPLIAVAQAGSRLVAVGPRGLIVTSDDGGLSWTQASVPVQSDLVAVQFADARTGWAAGHDSVILQTTDGGRNWTKQLDGMSARKIFEENYNKRIAAGDNSLSADLQEIQANFDPGPILPWLGLQFTSATAGFAIGPFGDLAYTSDGGKIWTPWLDHIDDPNFYDLNAIGVAGGNVYIVGEQGTVYIYDPKNQKFLARNTQYQGSLFGLVGHDKTLIVFGLRGSIFRSTDQGKNWTQSQNPSSSTIMDGTLLPNGHFVLVTVDGIELVSVDDGESFQPAGSPQDAPLSGVIARGGSLVITSLGGIRHAPGA